MDIWENVYIRRYNAIWTSDGHVRTIYSTWICLKLIRRRHLNVRWTPKQRYNLIKRHIKVMWMSADITSGKTYIHNFYFIWRRYNVIQTLWMSDEHLKHHYKACLLNSDLTFIWRQIIIILRHRTCPTYRFGVDTTPFECYKIRHWSNVMRPAKHSFVLTFIWRQIFIRNASKNWSDIIKPACLKSFFRLTSIQRQGAAHIAKWLRWSVINLLEKSIQVQLMQL